MMLPVKSRSARLRFAAVSATALPFCSKRRCGSPGTVSVGKSSFVQPSVRRPKTFQMSRLRRD